VSDWQQKSDAYLTERCLRDDIAAPQRCCLQDFAHCYWRYRPRTLGFSRASTRFAHVGATATEGRSFTRRLPQPGARRACLSLPATALSAARPLSASGPCAPRRITKNRRGLASYEGPDPRMMPPVLALGCRDGGIKQRKRLRLGGVRRGRASRSRPRCP
jgi:hypothetical protein